MVYAEKGNKVKRIDESEIKKYAEKGFKIKNESGEVVQETIPTDVSSLRIAYKAHIDEIKALKAEIADLKAQLAKKPAKATGSKLLDEVVAETVSEDATSEEVAEDKPKRSRKAKAD